MRMSIRNLLRDLFYGALLIWPYFFMPGNA